MESAAGAFTGTRDSWLLQDGIEDLSSLHPVVPANCLDTTRPRNDFHVTARYKLSALLLLLLLHTQLSYFHALLHQNYNNLMHSR